MIAMSYRALQEGARAEERLSFAWCSADGERRRVAVSRFFACVMLRVMLRIVHKANKQVAFAACDWDSTVAHPTAVHETVALRDGVNGAARVLR